MKTHPPLFCCVFLCGVWLSVSIVPMMNSKKLLRLCTLLQRSEMVRQRLLHLHFFARYEYQYFLAVSIFRELRPTRRCLHTHWGMTLHPVAGNFIAHMSIATTTSTLTKL